MDTLHYNVRRIACFGLTALLHGLLLIRWQCAMQMPSSDAAMTLFMLPTSPTIVTSKTAPVADTPLSRPIHLVTPSRSPEPLMTVTNIAPESTIATSASQPTILTRDVKTALQAIDAERHHPPTFATAHKNEMEKLGERVQLAATINRTGTIQTTFAANDGNRLTRVSTSYGKYCFLSRPPALHHHNQDSTVQKVPCSSYPEK